MGFYSLETIEFMKEVDITMLRKVLELKLQLRLRFILDNLREDLDREKGYK